MQSDRKEDVHISAPITWLVGHDWMPTSVKIWWYSEPPGINDVRVGMLLGIVLGIAGAYALITFAPP